MSQKFKFFYAPPLPAVVDASVGRENFANVKGFRCFAKFHITAIPKISRHRTVNFLFLECNTSFQVVFPQERPPKQTLLTKAKLTKSQLHNQENDHVENLG